MSSQDTSVDIDALRQHIGTKTEHFDVATTAPLHGMIVALDRNDPVPQKGDPVPPGWHQTYFQPMTRRAELGEDGLPLASDVLPRMPFPRRMFAGIDMTFHHPILVGDDIRRETELTDIQLRKGATGQLIFVTLARRTFTPRGLAIEDNYHGVFREEVKAGDKNPSTRRDEPPTNLPWQRKINADVVSLFRFSAITFNPHRIHYDRGYAMELEGYPGLVVHGPYSQQCLMDFARDHHPGKQMKTFSMRARAPLFDTAPFTLVGGPAGEAGQAKLWAVTPEGTIAMQATASFA